MRIHDPRAQRNSRGNFRGQHDKHEGHCQHHRRDREPTGRTIEEGRGTDQGSRQDTEDRSLRQVHRQTQSNSLLLDQLFPNQDWFSIFCMRNYGISYFCLVKSRNFVKGAVRMTMPLYYWTNCSSWIRNTVCKAVGSRLARS